MPQHGEMLILAVTRMRGGVCVAGMARAPGARAGLRWVRPVKARGTLLLGDIRYADGALMRPGDVVAWRLGADRPDPPHVEDVLVDPVRDQAALLRRIGPPRRAAFCAEHLDPAPGDVLDRAGRSLCLIRPDSAAALWERDPYSGHYEARMALRLGGYDSGPRGLPVTDLAWRAIGRAWMAGGRLALDAAGLRARVGDVYVAVGLGRMYAGRHWPLVVGVHAAGLPEPEIDEDQL